MLDRSFGSVAALLLTLSFGVTPSAFAQDCNGNGLEDADDITSAFSDDCNLNGIPDECENPPVALTTVRLKTFQRPDGRASRDKLRDVIATDLNGDGRDDIAVGREGGLAVLLAAPERSDVLSEEPTPYVVNGFSQRPWLAGFITEDEFPDIVTIEMEDFINGNGIRVLINDGTGAFDESVTVALAAGVNDVALGDLRGDGTDDIVSVNRRENRLTIIFTDGGGNLEESVEVSAAVMNDPQAVEVGDLDGDGSPDIIVVNRGANDIALLYNDGAGVFDTVGAISDVGPAPKRLFVAHLNQDDAVDLVVDPGERPTVFLSVGDGTFQPPLSLAYDRGRVLGLGGADLDRDGDTDILVGLSQPSQMQYFANDGFGRFNTGVALPLAVDANNIVVADVNRDLTPDVITHGNGTTTLTVFHNEEAESAISVSAPFTLNVLDEPHAADIADLDNDGDLDIVSANNNGLTFSFAWNRGDGTFEVDLIQFPVTGFYIISEDLNNDGYIDLATANLHSIVHVFLNAGDGTYPVPENMRQYPVGHNTFHLSAADLNGDGFLDLISSDQASDTISLLYNNGDGTFQDRRALAVRGRPESTGTGDLDGDGDVDIAVTSAETSTVVVFLNGGDEVFTEVRYQLVGPPSYLVVDDMDLDGHPDVIVSSVRGITVLWNAGDRSGQLNDRGDFLVGDTPYSFTTGDINGDDFPEVISTAELGDMGGVDGSRMTILLNNRDRTLKRVAVLPIGIGPRFTVTGDIDADGDLDLIGINRLSQDFTIYENQAADLKVGAFLRSVCTPFEYFSLSSPARLGSSKRRNGKYVAAARDELPHQALFQNVNRFVLHEDFLSQNFDEFAFIDGDPSAYDELVGRRATRDYYVGTLDLRQRDDGFLHTFNVVTDTGFDPREVLTQEELTDLYDRLRTHFLLEPLAYAPETVLDRTAAEDFIDPPFEVFVDNTPPPFEYEAYTLGIGYGRLRMLTLEEFEEANRQGRFTFQDGLVIDTAPPDIEGVVGFVFTGTIQGELAHLPIRTARRGTPNAFVSDLEGKLRPFDGQLVRVEVFPENFFVTPVDVSEAEDFWEQIRRELPGPPAIDVSYSALDDFLQMDLTGRPEGRYGGKASNLGRLQRVLLRDGALDSFVEPGFGIPTGFYREFMQSNFRGAQTYEEYVLDVVAREDVRTDSGLRFELLDEFRDFARSNAEVDADLVQDLALKIESVFGDLATMVRFRSSSNVEDALVFNGAGLYESTSVCALDTLDRNNLNSSYCDPSRNRERTIERALKKVWSSLWTFRAHEERTFYQIDPEDAVMGIAVTRAFLDEVGNGVAFTGSPRDVEDKRYVITAQIGEGSVVSPPAGTTVERTLLEVGEGGEVAKIIRSRASNQVDPGVVVVSDDELRELARFMWRVENAWEIELPEDVDRDQVIFDFEFKLEPDGSLAVKQIRPFLIPSVDLQTPEFELVVPTGTVLCGVYTDARQGRPVFAEYSTKSRVRLKRGITELPTDQESFSGDLIDEVIFGPDQLRAEPVALGTFALNVVADAGNETVYRYSYSQDFILPNSDELTLLISGLVFRGRGSIALEKRRTIDEDLIVDDAEEFAMTALVNTTPQTSYSSCIHRDFPRFRLDVDLDDRSRVSIVERYQAEVSRIKSSEVSIERAEVRLSGQEQVVRDYWRLAYGARRHNLDAEYLIVLDPPLDVQGVRDSVGAVEIVGLDGALFRDGLPIIEWPFDCEGAIVRLLDTDFAVMSETVASRCNKDFELTSPDELFVRGDFDANGSVGFADAIGFLRYFFSRGLSPPCRKSADTNDDGVLSISDGIEILLHLFAGTGPLAPPFGACGVDPTPDLLPCVSHPVCF